MTLSRSDPEDIRAWRRRAARKYEERKRAEGKKYASIGSNPERRKERYQRAYGGDERRSWVNGLPCLVCGVRPSENAHTETGGMGMKAPAHTVVPLCSRHHEEYDHGKQSFEEEYGLDMKAEAKKIEERWKRKQQNASG